MLLTLKFIKEFSFIQACAQYSQMGFCWLSLCSWRQKEGAKQSSQGIVLYKCRDIIIVFQTVESSCFAGIILLPHPSASLAFTAERPLMCIGSVFEINVHLKKEKLKVSQW